MLQVFKASVQQVLLNLAVVSQIIKTKHLLKSLSEQNPSPTFSLKLSQIQLTSWKEEESYFGYVTHPYFITKCLNGKCRSAMQQCHFWSHTFSLCYPLLMMLFLLYKL